MVQLSEVLELEFKFKLEYAFVASVGPTITPFKL